MRSTIISALIGTYATVAIVANPLARAIVPTGQVDANCNGPIVNLYAFTGAGCNNTDSNSEDVSPFFSLTKFSAVPSGSATPYRSECKRINAPGYKAASIVYSSDGANTDSCYLNLFDDDDCSGKRINQYGLDDDVSACITADVRYARVYCNQQTTTNAAKSRNGILGPEPQGARWS